MAVETFLRQIPHIGPYVADEVETILGQSGSNDELKEAWMVTASLVTLYLVNNLGIISTPLNIAAVAVQFPIRDRINAFLSKKESDKKAQEDERKEGPTIMQRGKKFLSGGRQTKGEGTDEVKRSFFDSLPPLEKFNVMPMLVGVTVIGTMFQKGLLNPKTILTLVATGGAAVKLQGYLKGRGLQQVIPETLAGGVTGLVMGITLSKW